MPARRCRPASGPTCGSTPPTSVGDFERHFRVRLDSVTDVARLRAVVHVAPHRAASLRAAPSPPTSSSRPTPTRSSPGAPCLRRLRRHRVRRERLRPARAGQPVRAARPRPGRRLAFFESDTGRAVAPGRSGPESWCTVPAHVVPEDAEIDPGADPLRAASLPVAPRSRADLVLAGACRHHPLHRGRQQRDEHHRVTTPDRERSPTGRTPARCRSRSDRPPAARRTRPAAGTRSATQEDQAEQQHGQQPRAHEQSQAAPQRRASARDTSANRDWIPVAGRARAPCSRAASRRPASVSPHPRLLRAGSACGPGRPPRPSARRVGTTHARHRATRAAARTKPHRDSVHQVGELADPCPGRRRTLRLARTPPPDGPRQPVAGRGCCTASELAPGLPGVEDLDQGPDEGQCHEVRTPLEPSQCPAEPPTRPPRSRATSAKPQSSPESLSEVVVGAPRRRGGPR